MLYIVLLHYPVYNKEGRIVTTAIANMDIHDIGRLAKMYGAKGFILPILYWNSGIWRKKLSAIGGKVTEQITINFGKPLLN